MSEHTRIPIIKIWHILLVPLQGQVDDALAEQLRQDVLQRIQTSEVAGLVMDVTGLWLMDSHLCSVLSQIASAARLMGTYTVICGMAPEIALTLQTMGLELSNVGTELSLEQALARLGVGVLDDGEVWESEPELEPEPEPMHRERGGVESKQ
jgi:rsbT antagonist protein RsbS